MRSKRRNVFETVREKRQWHSPPDPEATKLGFHGWHSRGYLPHFDIPGAVQFINYRLDDAMPTELRHEWAALLDIEEELQRRRSSRITWIVVAGVASCATRGPRRSWRRTGCTWTSNGIACSPGW